MGSEMCIRDRHPRVDPQAEDPVGVVGAHQFDEEAPQGVATDDAGEHLSLIHI